MSRRESLIPEGSPRLAKRRENDENSGRNTVRNKQISKRFDSYSEVFIVVNCVQNIKEEFIIHWKFSLDWTCC